MFSSLVSPAVPDRSSALWRFPSLIDIVSYFTMLYLYDVNYKNAKSAHTSIPFRGIINEPAYIHDIAEWLTKKLEIDFETVKKETTKNAEQLFRLSNS